MVHFKIVSKLIFIYFVYREGGGVGMQSMLDLF